MTRDPEMSRICEWIDIKRREEGEMNEYLKLQKTLESLDDQSNLLDENIIKLEEFINLMNHSNNDPQLDAIEVMNIKMMEYQKIVDSITLKVDMNELLKLEADINSLKTVINEKENLLEAYNGLKPNLHDAKIQVEQVAVIYNNLIEKKQNLMQNLVSKR